MKNQPLTGASGLHASLPDKFVQLEALKVRSGEGEATTPWSRRQPKAVRLSVDIATRRRKSLGHDDDELRGGGRFDRDACRAHAASVMGLLQAGSIEASAIGKGYAAFNDGVAMHGLKQVDRMLSNGGIDFDAFFATWIPSVLEGAAEVVLAGPSSTEMATPCWRSPR